MSRRKTHGPSWQATMYHIERRETETDNPDPVELDPEFFSQLQDWLEEPGYEIRPKITQKNDNDK